MPLMPINALVIAEDSSEVSALKSFEAENTVILRVIGTANDAAAAVELIMQKRPDLVFLDETVKADELFRLLGKLEFRIPKLLMVSTKKADAADAFRYNAIDFILKPLDPNLLMMAMYKVIRRIEMERSLQNQNIENVSAINLNIAKGFVAVSSMDKIDLLKMSDILFCKSERKYTVFHLEGGKKIMSSRNLGEYNKILDYNYFFRVHHSYIVNMRHVVTISKRDGFFCVFPDGITVPVATRRQEEFQRFMKL